MTIIIFFLILTLLVLIHEFGHFIAAKKSGVRVEEFGFGLPPRLFGIKKGDTIYSINLLPFGGFVRLYGEEFHEIKNKSLSKKAFIYKSPWQKTLIVIAGVVMNIFLAVFIYYGLLASQNFKSDLIPLPIPYRFAFGQQTGRVVIAGTVKGSPAEKAKIQTEEAVIAISKNKSRTPITSAGQMIAYIKNSENVPLKIELENIRNGQNKLVSITPYYNKELKRAVIGAGLVDAVIISYQSPNDKILSGFLHSYNMFAYNTSMMKYLISSSLKEKNINPVSQNLSGPFGIYKIVQDLISNSGQKIINNLLNLIAILSLSLAFVNILPFPALDGGRLMFVLYEGITKKRPNKNIEKYVNLVGMLILLSLAVIITINDIVKVYK